MWTLLLGVTFGLLASSRSEQLTGEGGCGFAQHTFFSLHLLHYRLLSFFFVAGLMVRLVVCCFPPPPPPVEPH